MTTNPYRLGDAVRPVDYRLQLRPNLEAATFSGHVDIDLELSAPTTEIRLNAIELEVTTAKVLSGSGSQTSTSVTLDETFETAAFGFAETIPAGSATLSLDFTGILNDQLHGFYRSTYVDTEGVTQTLATTQFESTDARRAFPCFDEPSLKATYQVSLRIPRDLAAFSNSKETGREDHGDGTVTVNFARTMKMSTYLVAFVVGPFDATPPIDVNGIELRAIFPRGKGHLTAFPLESAAHALTFFSTYFDIPYPGDKFDLIAIPDFAAGAMENLGLVTFREVDMLIDPERASQAQMERVAMVVNHETAHMWFGDLVTMEWWEGIWLNEAFATFMESICTDAFRPQWKKWAGFNPSRDGAFGVDSLHTTRPIEYEVVSPNDCRGMFDILTYIKGCSILRMLEQYLGEETFRDGIRIYLRRHSYANAKTADLWAALEESSGQPVGAIMDTWIYQGGFPLLTVEDGHITQHPFSFTPAHGPSAIGESWKVPVLTRSLGSTEVTRQLLEGTSAPLAPGATVVNAGGSGFYRVAYGPRELRTISGGLTQLDEVERASLFADTWSAALAGRAGATDVFTLARGMGDLDEPSVWAVVQQAARLLNRLVDDEGRAALAEVLGQLLRPQLERLGWESQDGESEQAGTLRALVIDLLGTIALDADVVGEALRRFDAQQVVGDLADPILAIVARQNRPGDTTTLDERRTSAPTPQEELGYLQAMAQVRNLVFARELFERCFTDIRNQDAPYVILTMMTNPVTGPDIWRLATERIEQISSAFPTGSPAAMFRAVAAFASDPDFAAEVRKYHEGHPLPVAQRQVEQALERMDVSVAFGQRVRGTLTQQLKGALS